MMVNLTMKLKCELNWIGHNTGGGRLIYRHMLGYKSSEIL